MNSILDEIINENIWNEYIDFKEKQLSVSRQELDEIRKYVSSKKYINIARAIAKGEYTFSIPTKHFINKINKSKKRVVYTYNEEEKYSNNFYSFRRNIIVKDGIKRIISTPNLNQLYGYKIDISNYFNSIDINLLLKKLETFLSSDKRLFNFIKKLLLDDKVMLNGEIIHEKKGIMAGVSISSFLANIFLTEIDTYFESENALYLRYSDDIILFAEKELIDYYIEKLDNFILINKLTINEEKRKYILPNDKWDYLGFSIENGEIDISNISKQKIKGKIKRISRKLRRWMLKKDAKPERAILAMNRKINKKFYGMNNNNELTWELWYFPIINTTKGIHEIDLYVQQTLRYIATGKYNKKNYNITYTKLKELGYRPLVSEYYKFKNKDNEKKQTLKNI